MTIVSLAGLMALPGKPQVAAVKQEQFLHVLDRDEAERRFRAALNLRPLPAERAPLHQALYRVLAEDVVAPLDVPSFDRSNVDGFAVRAADTFGASEEEPVTLRLNPETLLPGMVPQITVQPGTATPIATGAMVPRGADAVVMVEYTDFTSPKRETKRQGDRETGKQGDKKTEAASPCRNLPVSLSPCLLVFRPVAPGTNLTFAGTDIGRGETVLRQGDLLTSRETGVLAALGLAEVTVVRRPVVAILATGTELVAPGEPLQTGQVYDSNSIMLADAVQELGGVPRVLGIVPDDADVLREKLEAALDLADVVLLSGGTSKGEGDLSYRVVANLGPPGIIAHGVALKPGKPLCLAAVQRQDRIIPVVILPGFPTSAIFTFHEFVAPVIGGLAGRQQEPAPILRARLPMRINSERGRTEYVLVGLVPSTGVADQEAENQKRETRDDAASLSAFPLGKGSGSVTSFSRADGFVIIPRQQEYLEAGSIVAVHLLDRQLQPADLVVIGSHCTGLDFLLRELQRRRFRTKLLAVGSTRGLEAARRRECDVAGIHLLDPVSGVYNRPFAAPDLVLLPGYRRLQGIVFRPGDPRFSSTSPSTIIRNVVTDPDCVLVNRNRGSGTRVLIDQLLGSARPAGYWTEARSHNAVAAAVAQGRADWGVAIEPVARAAGLDFVFLQEERYDFVVPPDRLDRPAVQALQQLLTEPAVRQHLTTMGFRVD